jgi:predicted Zn-ribbon and HTH transcriptional regulator
MRERSTLVHKLALLPESPMLGALMARLDDAGIEAFQVTERSIAQIYVGATPSASVWIRDEKDIEAARVILDDVRAAATRATCRKCGYDLRGHRDRAHCPECGTAVSVSEPDVPCPACGEAVPANFTVCWNCGETICTEDAS